MKPVFSFTRGSTPLLVSIPHAGEFVPGVINDRLLTVARQLPDTDWYVDRLYQWVTERGGSVLVANYSRYVIDLNRPPDDAPLYTASGSGLLPERAFDGEPLYKNGLLPGVNVVRQRLQHYWQPYHDKLATELKEIRRQFGHAVLLDAHSILSKVPSLFEGTLPDLNLGSFKSASAAPGLVAASMAALQVDPCYSTVLDGRFQGGYITRHYGSPDKEVHALQLEMAQSTYMDEKTGSYDERRAQRLIPVLQGLVDALIRWTPADG
jgi:N-formylglutamate amidohydrolase